MPSQDYEEFIAALNAHGVRYLVVGAHAVAFHARPRANRDLDILIEPTPANARRALTALRAFFGGTELGYTVEDLINPRWIIQWESPPYGSACFPNYQACRVSRRRGRAGLMLILAPSPPTILDWMISPVPRKRATGRRTERMSAFFIVPKAGS